MEEHLIMWNHAPKQSDVTLTGCKFIASVRMRPSTGQFLKFKGRITAIEEISVMEREYDNTKWLWGQFSLFNSFNKECLEDLAQIAFIISIVLLCLPTLFPDHLQSLLQYISSR